MRTALSFAATTTALLISNFSARTKAMATTNAAAKIIPASLPTLKGVVFDMDDTLVRANLDIRAMYREVFGTEPAEQYDILKEIDAIEYPEEKARANEIIEGIEETSRQQMELEPGCAELLTWLSAHKIPKALVTRNNRKTTDAFCKKLQLLEETSNKDDLNLSFEKIITRDDASGNPPIPHKPDPTAMIIIASESFGVTQDTDGNLPGILMVGDSVSNDVGFGKNAGTQTALLVNKMNAHKSEGAADITIQSLVELPRLIWNTFEIDGPMGNTDAANQLPLHGSPPPKPQNELCRAVCDGNIETVRTILEDLSLDDILKEDDTNGNTALIWACETGNAELASLLMEVVVSKSRHQSVWSSFANHRGFLGATALNRAARRGHKHVLEALLEDDLEDEPDHPKIPGSLFDLDLPNDKLQHPLHFAAFKKNPESLNYLLDNGANPWVLDRKGRTPLQDTSCETCKSLLREATAKGGSGR